MLLDSLLYKRSRAMRNKITHIMDKIDDIIVDNVFVSFVIIMILAMITVSSL